MAFNIFKPKNKRKKLKINEDTVKNFLNGTYEKELFGSELLGIRDIEVSYRHNNVDIIFCKDFRPNGKPMYTHKGGLKPFLWAKKLTTSTFFTHNVVNIDKDLVSNSHVALPNGDVVEIDGKDVRIIDETDDEFVIRYKITSFDEWKRVVNKKQRLYGINIEQQITSFEDNVVSRMKTGFKYKITINKCDELKYSDNHYFNSRRDKINGSFNNLLNFFREGGIAPRGSKYLDEDKLKNWFNFLALDEEILARWFINLYKWRKVFNPFTKSSCNFGKLIGFYKTINPKIAYRINKTYINEIVDDNPDKIVDDLLDNNKRLSDFFNIQLDEQKIINYIVQPYTFDSSRDSSDLLDFLDSMGIDLYRELEPQLFFINPLEQYMIQTGRRLFKGVDDYTDLEILTIDIETTAQKGNEHIDIAALKPELGRVFQIGIGDNKGYEEFLHAKKPSEEADILIRTYEIIGERDPDIILTYNGEGFDFPFMEKRLELLGFVSEEYNGKKTAAQYIREIMSPYYEDYGNVYNFFYYRRNSNAILKVGGGTEDYTQTRMFGKNICDVMFAVKRAAAIDTKIPNHKLKDNIIHAELAAPNRVYMEGDKIGEYEADKRPYYLNKTNGEYFVSQKSIEFFEGDYDESLVKEGDGDVLFYKNRKKLYLYADDGSDEISLEVKECVNTFPIKIQHNGYLLNDSNFHVAKSVLERNFLGFYQKSLEYESIVAPIKGLGYDKLKNSPKVLGLLKSKLKLIRTFFKDVKKIHELLEKHQEEVDVEYIDSKIWENYDKVSGSYLVQRYLSDDIKEPYQLDELYSQATFAISKWLPTKYEKIATMGNANVWKLLLAAWSYLNCVAIPDYEEPKEYTGGLLGMVAAGFHKKIVKIDYSSLYPSEFIEHCGAPDIDITGIYKELVKFGLYTRLEYKDLKNKAKANGDSVMEQHYDKKQLPLKILINSFYGMLGAPKVSPFCHIDSAWHITCSGRQHMRHLIHYFKPRGFKIIYFHTDGANFVIPKDVDEYSYVSNGANWKNEKGKEYIGVEAYVAEYNDLFMKGKMAVDIDEYAISCINFSKGNFSYLKEKKGKLQISHVGGTLDKKNQNQYISDFFDTHLETLFLGEGADFLDAYYDYVKKIYNRDIVAGKIANKSRVKKSVEDYLRHIKENNGSRQAHMELAIQNDLRIEVGDWIYTLNDGDGKNDIGDLKTINDCMGYFIYETEKQAKEMLNKLKKSKDDLDDIKECLLLAEKNGDFIFKSNRMYIEDENGEEKSVKVSKKNKIDEIYEVEKLKFKYKLKVTKRRGEEHTVEVYFVTRNLNARLVKKEDLDAKLPYNPIKYIEKFNKSMENIWIVFHPEIRDKIPTPNRKSKTGESFDRKPNQRGWFTDKELELVSGYPLEGKEDKQQDLDELLVVTEEELEFWKHMGYSPNHSFDNQEISLDELYYVTEENEIFKGDCPSDKNVTKMYGEELIEWLTDKILLDYDNPPYKFI